MNIHTKFIENWNYFNYILYVMCIFNDDDKFWFSLIEED